MFDRDIHKKYDFICSLGEACFTATFIKKLHLRNFSSPFDWVVGGTLSARVEFIINKFQNFFNKEDLHYIGKREYPSPCDIYQNKTSNIVFNHDFKINGNFEEEYCSVAEKYQRRCKRLIEYMEHAKSVLFVYMELPQTKSGIAQNSDWVSILEKLKAGFPKTNIDIMYVKHNDNLPDKQIIKSEITPNITIFECYNKNRENENDVGSGNFANAKLCFKNITCKGYYKNLIGYTISHLGKNLCKMVYYHKQKPNKQEYIRIFGIKVYKDNHNINNCLF